MNLPVTIQYYTVKSNNKLLLNNSERYNPSKQCIVLYNTIPYNTVHYEIIANHHPNKHLDYFPQDNFTTNKLLALFICLRDGWTRHIQDEVPWCICYL